MILAPSQYLSLKFLIEDNDEDLYTYFEEYVENSGGLSSGFRDRG
jgi:hypothetical protein